MPQSGGSHNLMEPFQEKPKGMRWSQYLRLLERASRAESASWSALGDTLSRLERSLLPPTWHPRYTSLPRWESGRTVSLKTR